MKKITTLFTAAGLLLLGVISAFAQLSTNQIRYQVTYDVPTQRYTVWVVPLYNTPNVNNPNVNEFGGTAQVTLKVPPNFIITDLTDISGVWDKNLVKLGNVLTQTAFAEQTFDKNFQYYSIGKSPTEINYGPFIANQPKPLFSFQGNGCFGPVSVLDKADPFVTAAFNAYSLNVEASFYSRSGQPPGGNAQPREQFVAKLGPDAECQSTNPNRIDLSLTTSISNQFPNKGDAVTLTITVNNSGPDAATGVQIAGNLPAGLTLTGSSATVGTYTNGTWNIGSLAANQTVTLTLNATVGTTGLVFFSSEVASANEQDSDSVPGNGNISEDDISRSCLTVPVLLCEGQNLTVTLPAGYTNIQWYRNSVPLVGANTSQLAINSVGTYTYTATNATCPSGQCCPVVVTEGNCCPTAICIPVTITRVRRIQ